MFIVTDYLIEDCVFLYLFLFLHNGDHHRCCQRYGKYLAFTHNTYWLKMSWRSGEVGKLLLCVREVESGL